jgi:uncharacterized membrane protein YfcA
MALAGAAVLAFVAAALGSLGGLGGAILLVPVLVVAGTPAAEAAPLGLVMVAAASIAAGPRQLEERSVNHRLGVATELFASAGAVVGAILSGLFSEAFLTYLLAAVAAGAALAGGRQSGLRNRPDPACHTTDVGERVGSLAGAYPLGDGIVPYRPVRLRPGLAFMGLAGFVAGTSGASGGFIKTPATTEIMTVPMKVAASTTTFTVGITASAALVVFAFQGRIDVEAASAVIVGSLLGGQTGAALQSRLAPPAVRRLLSGLLLVIAVLLVVSA